MVRGRAAAGAAAPLRVLPAPFHAVEGPASVGLPGGSGSRWDGYGRGHAACTTQRSRRGCNGWVRRARRSPSGPIA